MAEIFLTTQPSIKHVILLTDGGADPTGIPKLVEGLFNDYRITLTTVGLVGMLPPSWKTLPDWEGDVTTIQTHRNLSLAFSPKRPLWPPGRILSKCHLSRSYIRILLFSPLAKRLLPSYPPSWLRWRDCQKIQPKPFLYPQEGTPSW